MKMRYFASLFLVGFLGFAAFSSEHFWSGETLSSKEVKTRWGDHPLVFSEFSKGNDAVRAKMAYQILMRKNEFKGMFVTEVREKFGSPTGYYFSDTFPAYLIQRAETRQEEAWQIVFLLNQERKVTNVIVHKSCCD